MKKSIIIGTALLSTLALFTSCENSVNRNSKEPSEIEESTSSFISYEGTMVSDLNGSYYKRSIDFNINYNNFVTGNNCDFSEDRAKLLLALSNDAYLNNYAELKAKSRNIEDRSNLYSTLDLTDLIPIELNANDYKSNKDDLTGAVMARKTIIEDGKAYDLVFITIRGTKGSSEWVSDFDMGSDTEDYYNINGECDSWLNKKNHKGFDIASNRIKTHIDTYLNENSNKNKILVFTGHSRGGAIANILSPLYADKYKDQYKVFCYTFASPNVTTEPVSAPYIFNIINEDDIITYFPCWTFKRNGKDIAYSTNEILMNTNEAFIEDLDGIESDYTNCDASSWYKVIENIADSREALYEKSFQNYIIQKCFLNHPDQDNSHKLEKYNPALSLLSLTFTNDYEKYLEPVFPEAYTKAEYKDEIIIDYLKKIGNSESSDEYSIMEDISSGYVLSSACPSLLFHEATLMFSNPKQAMINFTLCSPIDEKLQTLLEIFSYAAQNGSLNTSHNPLSYGVIVDNM